MKKSLFFLICLSCLLIENIVSAGNSSKKLPGISTINLLDTVVFDISKAVSHGNSIDIPVSILSDDTINALDFSLKYNHSHLHYDTILDLTTYMQSLSYYNPTDSTIRFTSNSLTRYDNATSLVLIRFTMLNPQLLNTDLKTLKGYLNGNSCSVKLVGTVVYQGISTIDNNSAKVYPNPANEFLNVTVTEDTEVELLDINGRFVLPPNNLRANGHVEINTQDLVNGIYVLKINSDQGLSTKKVLIHH